MKCSSASIFASLLFAAFMRLCFSEGTVQLNDDVLGLLAFKSALKDPSRNLDSWNEDDDSPCAWKFVKCDPNNGRASELWLGGLSLSGKIGRGLEKLNFLKVLDLSGNNLSGSLNADMVLVTSLERINLSHNHLTGEIPSFLDKMASIQFLDLSMNSLSGPVSDGMFGNCSTLSFLSFAGNSLEGKIPSSLHKCALLNHLNLSGNRFSGKPAFSGGIWTLNRLRTLDLSNNALSGSLPAGIAALSNLQELFLNGNQFSETLPADIGLCPHLNKLDLSCNLFTEGIPESWQKLTVLAYLNLSNNLLTGDFPQWISALTSLEHLDFSGNGLVGFLPLAMGELKLLKFLSLSNNRISGTIPESMGSCSSLALIRLRGNAFNGSIPKGVFDMKLEEVDLSRNRLTGSIPVPAGKIFKSLQKLDLSDNSLSGEILGNIEIYANLGYLNLSWNLLQSRIPPEIGHFHNLSVLDLRNNGLMGSIPADLCYSGSLTVLQLDGNSLEGPIPDQIGNCSSLDLLSLSHNNLSGQIPKTMSMLENLKILKLECNELSGEIPQNLGNLQHLLIANVSYNLLVGRLPAEGIFPTLDKSAIEGNSGICSPLLRGPCKLDVPKPLVLDPSAYGHGMGGDEQHSDANPEANFSHHRFLSLSSVIVISAAGLIAAGVMVIALLNASARRKIAFAEDAMESMCSSSTKSENLAAGKLTLFHSKTTPTPDWASTGLELMLNKATQIGKGVFGTVYKASLGSGSESTTLMAIKRLATGNTLQYQEEFDREVRILGKARHPNVAALRGYYWTPQLQLLLSDYSVSGSLQARIHDKSPSSSPLLWPDRFKIMLGTANGLAYLHSFRPPIIHYNVKPSNILMDENQNPRVSDFGLARLMSRIDKHVASNRFQSAPGYVAPELACRSLRVDEKCDVYGFGVLVLELVTGRRPVEYGEDNVVILSDHVRAMMEGGLLLDCVDGKMGRHWGEEEVVPLLKLALVCTSQIPSSRPSMAEVVQILQVIQTAVAHRI